MVFGPGDTETGDWGVRMICGFIAGVCAANIGWCVPSIAARGEAHSGNVIALFIMCVIGTVAAVLGAVVEIVHQGAKE